jgi:hypothetical protein
MKSNDNLMSADDFAEWAELKRRMEYLELRSSFEYCECGIVKSRVDAAYSDVQVRRKPH